MRQTTIHCINGDLINALSSPRRRESHIKQSMNENVTSLLMKIVGKQNHEMTSKLREKLSAKLVRASAYIELPTATLGIRSPSCRDKHPDIEIFVKSRVRGVDVQTSGN